VDKVDRVVDRLQEQLEVPRELLEDLLVDLDRAKVLRGFLIWQQEQAVSRLCRVEDPQALVRWQSKVEGFERAITVLNGIMDVLINEGVIDG